MSMHAHRSCGWSVRKLVVTGKFSQRRKVGENKERFGEGGG